MGLVGRVLGRVEDLEVVHHHEVERARRGDGEGGGADVVDVAAAVDHAQVELHVRARRGLEGGDVVLAQPPAAQEPGVDLRVGAGEAPVERLRAHLLRDHQHRAPLPRRVERDLEHPRRLAPALVRGDDDELPAVQATGEVAEAVLVAVERGEARRHRGAATREGLGDLVPRRLDDVRHAARGLAAALGAGLGDAREAVAQRGGAARPEVGGGRLARLEHPAGGGEVGDDARVRLDVRPRGEGLVEVAEVLHPADGVEEAVLVLVAPRAAQLGGEGDDVEAVAALDHLPHAGEEHVVPRLEEVAPVVPAPGHVARAAAADHAARGLVDGGRLLVGEEERAEHGALGLLVDEGPRGLPGRGGSGLRDGAERGSSVMHRRSPSGVAGRR